MFFEKRSLINQHLPLCCTSQQFKFVARFSLSIQKLSQLLKSDTFVYFTKVTAATWSIRKSIFVSTALMTHFSLFVDCQIDVEASPNGM